MIEKLVIAIVLSIFLTLPNSALASDCKDIVQSNSRLARDIATIKEAAECKYQRDKSGRKILFFAVEGKLDPASATFSGHNFPDQLRVVVVRYDEALSLSKLPKIGIQPELRSLQMKVLKSATNDQPDNGPAIAYITRLDESETKISSACVIGDFVKRDGKPSRVIVCRSVDRGSSDEAILEKAREIALQDLPAVNP